MYRSWPPRSTSPLFDVIAEPNRRRILDLLLEHERPVGDLVAGARGEPARGVEAPAGAARRRPRRGAHRRATPRSTACDAEPLHSIDEWLAPYRAMWSARLDDLERHLDSMPD